jgi:hypothetical protein
MEWHYTPNAKGKRIFKDLARSESVYLMTSPGQSREDDYYNTTPE